jgi:hypothetical protein
VTALADSPAAAARRMAGALNAGLPADGIDLEAVTGPHRRPNHAPGSDGPRGVRQNMHAEVRRPAARDRTSAPHEKHLTYRRKTARSALPDPEPSSHDS